MAQSPLNARPADGVESPALAAEIHPKFTSEKLRGICAGEKGGERGEGGARGRGRDERGRRKGER